MCDVAVRCSQGRLFPDPQPIVDRLGREFFLGAPQSPGVYLMSDEHSAVLYVGKAKNLRRRLTAYRVANSDRLPRRLVRLLWSVRAIEWEICSDESAAIAREAELLRTLKPRFNRVGTWSAPPAFLVWRLSGGQIELALTTTPQPDWAVIEGLRGARHAWALFVRVLWCALNPERGVAGMPAGWFHCEAVRHVAIPCSGANPAFARDLGAKLGEVARRVTAPFLECLREGITKQAHPFEQSTQHADIEDLAELLDRPNQILR